MGDFDFGTGPVEKGNVVAERAEPVATIWRIGDRSRCDTLDGVGLDAPYEEAEVGDVVATATVFDPADFGGTVEGFERATGQFKPVGVAQGYRRRAIQPDMAKMLSGYQVGEVFDDPTRPAGDITDELFEDGCCPFAAAVAQGIGDIGTQADIGDGGQFTE
ncbi:MAG: hypothetical protein ACUVSZ_12915 [Chloroflexus sp.]|uniref:hypothetical protein n=1 Tax=Chloroflexus sp. TaxID=1904827 RepID=UPI004048FC36